MRRYRRPGPSGFPFSVCRVATLCSDRRLVTDKRSQACNFNCRDTPGHDDLSGFHPPDASSKDITGFSFSVGMDIYGKQLELLKETVSSVRNRDVISKELH